MKSFLVEGVTRWLTFEVRRGRRRSAGPAGGMINSTRRRAWCFAVGPRLDRGVRPRSWREAHTFGFLLFGAESLGPASLCTLVS